MDRTFDKPAFRSIAFAEQMALARSHLAKPRRRAATWPALMAAALFAASSIAFMGVVLVAPKPGFDVVKSDVKPRQN